MRKTSEEFNSNTNSMEENRKAGARNAKLRNFHHTPVEDGISTKLQLGFWE